MTRRDSKSEDLFGNVSRGAMITSITPRPSDPNQRVVRVDGKVIATLRAVDVDSLRLKKGANWTTSIAESVASAIAHAKARKVAIRLLGARPCSRQELVAKLTTRSHAKVIAENVADELQKDHWLDDRAYAEMVVRQTTRSRPAAKAMLMDKLTRRGIDRKLAEVVTRTSLALEQPIEQATEFARRKLAELSSVGPMKASRRVASALSRRGFEDEIVAQALERVGLSLDDAPPDHDEYGEPDL